MAGAEGNPAPPERPGGTRGTGFGGAPPRRGAERPKILRALRIGGKTLAWLLIIPIILVLATLDLLQRPGGQEVLRRIALEQAGKQLPGLRIGQLRGNFTEWVALDDVVLDDRFGGEAIRARHIGLSYDLSELARGVLQIKGIELVEPEIHVKPAKNGKLNLAELVVPREEEEPEEPPGEPTSMRLRLDRLRIRGGRVFVAGASGPLSVTDLDIDLAGGGGVAGGSLDLRRIAARVQLPDGRKLSGALSGKARINEQEVDAALDATVDGVTPSGKVTLDLEARGPLSRVVLDTKVGLPGEGQIALAGWVSPEGPRYDVTTTLSRVDPSRLLAGLIPAQINLQLKAEGQGVPLSPGSRAKVALETREGCVVQGLSVGSLRIQASTNGAEWTLSRLGLRAAGGNVRISGRGTLERVDATVRVRLPHLERMPARIKRLGVPPDLAGAVNLTAHVKGLLSGPLRARASGGVRGLAVAGKRVDRVDLKGDFRGLPGAPTGKLSLEVDGVDIGNPDLAIQRARLSVGGRPDRLHLELSAQGPRLKADIAADTHIVAKGKRVTVDLRRLKLAGLGHRLALRNEPRLSYDARRIALSRTRLALLGGVVAVEGVFRPRGFPRAEATVSVEGVRPPLPRMRRKVNSKLRATLGRRTLDARLEASIPSLGSNVKLFANLPLRYRRGAPQPRMDGDGTVQLRVDGLALRILNELAPKLPPAGGELGLTLDVNGRLDDPDLDLGVDLQRARWDKLRDVNADLKVQVAGGQTRLSSRVSMAGVELARLSVGAPLGLGPLIKGQRELARFKDTPVELRLEHPPARLGKAPLAALHPMLGRLTGTVSSSLAVKGPLLRPRVRHRVRLVDGVLDGKARLGTLSTDVTAEATATALKTTLAVDQGRCGPAGAGGRCKTTPLLRGSGEVGLSLERLVSDLGRSAPARGGAPPLPSARKHSHKLDAIPLSVDLRLPGYALDRLRELDGGLAGISGRLSMAARVRGTTKRPEGKVTLQVRKAGYTGVPIGDLTVKAALRDRRLSSAFSLRQPGGGRIAWKGRMGLPTGDGFEGRLRGKGLDLAFLHRLVSPLKDSAGKLSLDLRAQGSLARPRVEGHVTMQQGKVRVRGVSPIEGIGARLELRPGQLRLVRLGLRGDRGTLGLTGRVDLSSDTLDVSAGPRLLKGFSLVARAREFGVDAGGMSGVRFNGDVKVDGGLRGKDLAVRVRLDDAVVHIPEMEGKQQLHSAAPLSDVVYAEDERRRARQKRGRARAATAPVGFRADVDADPIFVRGKEVDLEVATDLTARTDAKGRVRIRGKVEIRRGRIRALNNVFEVRQATVSFSGEPVPDPALNILLARAAPDATVFVQLTGTASAPELKLRSDPPIYDQGQILSLLLTGRVDARPDSSGESDQTMVVASAVSQVLLGSIARKIAPKVGIDVARVRFDESKDERTGESSLRAEAELGKYLTERLYVAYRRVFGASTEENANEGLMEYRISARWLLMAVFGDAGVGGVDLVWNLQY
jgi:autotransporter translocation and assembly factor TamB